MDDLTHTDHELTIFSSPPGGSIKSKVSVVGILFYTDAAEVSEHPIMFEPQPHSKHFLPASS